MVVLGAAARRLGPGGPVAVPRRCRGTAGPAGDSPGGPGLLTMVEAFFKRAAARVETGEGRRGGQAWVRGILETIRRCSCILEVSFPLRRDSGTWEVVQGWRVQHSQHCLPCKGGEAGSRGPAAQFCIPVQPRTRGLMLLTWGSGHILRCPGGCFPWLHPAGEEAPGGGTFATLHGSTVVIWPPPPLCVTPHPKQHIPAALNTPQSSDGCSEPEGSQPLVPSA